MCFLTVLQLIYTFSTSRLSALIVNLTLGFINILCMPAPMESATQRPQQKASEAYAQLAELISVSWYTNHIKPACRIRAHTLLSVLLLNSPPAATVRAHFQTFERFTNSDSVMLLQVLVNNRVPELLQSLPASLPLESLSLRPEHVDWLQRQRKQRQKKRSRGLSLLMYGTHLLYSRKNPRPPFLRLEALLSR